MSVLAVPRQHAHAGTSISVCSACVAWVSVLGWNAQSKPVASLDNFKISGHPAGLGTGEACTIQGLCRWDRPQLLSQGIAGIAQRAISVIPLHLYRGEWPSCKVLTVCAAYLIWKLFIQLSIKCMQVIEEAKKRGQEKAKKTKSMIVMDVKPWDDTTGDATPELASHKCLLCACSDRSWPVHV